MTIYRRSVYIAVFLVLSLGLGCKKNSDDNKWWLLALAGTNNGNGNLKITFHDAPLVGTNIEKVNITVLETQIIDFYDKKITVSDQTYSFDLLQLTANNPVVLAHASVPPGTYKQIRLILDDNSSLTFTDNSTAPLTVPSGEQTGIKIDGIFTVPDEKLYTLDIDLDPSKSIHHAPGKGWMLKPVITLTGENILQGNFAYKGNIGSSDFVYNLKSNGTFDLILAKKPDYEIFGDYRYNGLNKTLTMILKRGICSSCDPVVEIDLVKDYSDIDNDVNYDVISWGAEYIELKSETGGIMTLNSIPIFDISAVRKNVKLNTAINVTDPSHEGRFLVGMLYPVKGAGESPTVFTQIISGKAYLNFLISEQEVPAGELRNYRITLAVVNSLDDIVLGEDRVKDVNNVLDIKSGPETEFSLNRQDNPKVLQMTL